MTERCLYFISTFIPSSDTAEPAPNSSDSSSLGNLPLLNETIPCVRSDSFLYHNLTPHYILAYLSNLKAFKEDSYNLWPNIPQLLLLSKFKPPSAMNKKKKSKCETKTFSSSKVIQAEEQFSNIITKKNCVKRNNIIRKKHKCEEEKTWLQNYRLKNLMEAENRRLYSTENRISELVNKLKRNWRKNIRRKL